MGWNLCRFKLIFFIFCCCWKVSLFILVLYAGEIVIINLNWKKTLMLKIISTVDMDLYTYHHLSVNWVVLAWLTL